MKKFIIAMTALFAMTISANAMSYEQARQQALFLTDKMAYELNLTEEQYEAAYEINLDYLIGVNSYDDVYGTYWTHRNLDMSYVLFDWQYRAFCAASYFYRPIYWNAGYWHFAIYARYPRRDYFYFGRPHFWTSYRGGHSWRSNGGRSWYHGRSFGPRSGHSGRHFGMQDGHKRGDYHNGFDNRTRNNGNRNWNAGRRNHDMGDRRNGNNMGNRHDNDINRQSGNNRNGRHGTLGSGTHQDRQTGTQRFGNRREPGSSVNRGTRHTPTRESSTRTTVTRNPGAGTTRNFGNTPSRHSSSPSHSFSPSRSSGSSANRPSHSFSGGSRSMGGSHHSGSHGGRR